MSGMAPAPATSSSTSCVPARPSSRGRSRRGTRSSSSRARRPSASSTPPWSRCGEATATRTSADGEALSAHAARAQHNHLPARLAMKAHRCHHLAVKPIRAAVRFDLMAHLDGGVYGARRRSRQNAAVVKQHCGRAVMVVAGEARINEFPAGRDGGVEICFLHGTILGWSAIVGADPPGGQATISHPAGLPVVRGEEACSPPGSTSWRPSPPTEPHSAADRSRARRDRSRRVPAPPPSGAAIQGRRLERGWWPESRYWARLHGC